MSSKAVQGYVAEQLKLVHKLSTKIEKYPNLNQYVLNTIL